MTWLKLDHDFFTDPKVLGCSHTSKLLYIAGLCHAGGQLTDGVLEAAVLPLLYFQTGGTDGNTDELVDRGLWTRHPAGLEIVGFLAHQQSKADIEDRRRRDAERKRVAREKRRERDVRADSARNPGGVRSIDIDEIQITPSTAASYPQGTSPARSADEELARARQLGVPETELTGGNHV